MKELQVFKNSEFGEIRVQSIDNDTWFCLSDLCRTLELTNPSEVKKRLSEKGLSYIDTLTNGGNQALVYVNESNLYKVIFQSRKPEAEKFTEWVTSEILPSIRKHGLYATDELLNDPDLAIKAFTALKEEREKNKVLELKTAQQSQIINELKPKADYTDSILKNKGLVTITQIAKDYGMTGQAMNEMLHDLKIQYKQSDQWLLYREHQDKGYTHSETINITRKGGIPDITMNTKWTQKGRLFIYGLLKGVGILPVIERDQKGA